MTITEAKEKCKELRKQVAIMQEGYWGSEGYLKRMGQEERKPLEDEIEKLIRAIYIAEDKTMVEINN